MRIAAIVGVIALIIGTALWWIAGADSLVDRVKRDGVAEMASDHPAMAAAFERARATLDDFLRIAKAPSPSLESLALKVRVTEGPNSEYFWVSPFQIESEGFAGTLSNEPRLVRNVKAGQSLKFSRADVVDWMYYDSSKRRMYGNFTACALLTQESPDDRAKFKEQYGLQCDG